MQENFNFPTREQLLLNHTSEATAYVVNDYPYGFRLRCKIRYWIESDKKKGDRYCTQTTNPKVAGEVWNKPKKTTYSTMMFMYLDAKGHVTYYSLSYHGETKGKNDKIKAIMNFLVNTYGVDNMSEIQKTSIRMTYYLSEQVSYSYNKQRYSEGEKRDAFTQHIKAKITHIAKADFATIADFADAPEQDQPEQEVGFITRTYVAESAA